jgi:tRNA threonylcarbamoyladenosine biosynthesis protein TsaE
MHLVSQSAADTQAIAASFAHRLRAAIPSRQAALVVALQGPLGAGKTTFVQGMARALGVTAQPKSPTFLLAKEYLIPDTPYHLWHLDCYRLQSHRDLVAIDMHRAFKDPKNIIVIEWPERIDGGLPRDHIAVHMDHAGGDKRAITIPA